MLSCVCLPCTQELEAGGCISYIVRSRLGLYKMVSKQDEQEGQATESLECLPKLWKMMSDFWPKLSELCVCQVAFTELNVVIGGQNHGEHLGCVSELCSWHLWAWFPDLPAGPVAPFAQSGKGPQLQIRSHSPFYSQVYCSLQSDREVRVPVHSTKPHSIFPSMTMWRWKLFKTKPKTPRSWIQHT